ncbi:unnamed protein product, partial [marine sediment metagenome]
FFLRKNINANNLKNFVLSFREELATRNLTS